jgi:dienelactone hydrolase
MPEFTPYQVHPHLRARFDAVGRKLAFNADTVESWQHWRAQLGGKLRELTGYDTMVPTPPDAVVTEELKFDGYTRQRVELRTEPDVIMTLYVLIPDGVSGPAPAVMAPHGHSSGGKYAVVDNRIDDDVSQTIDKLNYAYAVQFVREGFIVFAPDARGFGERQENAALQGSLLGSSCQWINNMAYPLGQTVTGMWAWDLHRLIDYIETRDDADSSRVGCAGLSGGGLQTLWASALDERIRCSVVSGYMYGYKQSLLDLHGNCSCNYVPHLYEYVDMGDIAALIAPRPLLIETGDIDPLNGADGLDNVKPQVEMARAAYRVAGSEDDLYHDIFPGPHRWNGIEAIPWMRKHLMGK